MNILTKFNLYKDNSKFIEHLKKGDEDAYAYLVFNYHKPLFVYALSLTNESANADDIVQNVFLKTWEFRKRLNPDYSIKSFLYKATYNEFINQYNKNEVISKLKIAYLEALDEAIDENNSELINKKIALINNCISNLPPKCKETFILSKKEGLTNEEIAEYLNLSIKTVEGHLTKAYQILRKSVKIKINKILFLLFGYLKTSKFNTNI